MLAFFLQFNGQLRHNTEPEVAERETGACECGHVTRVHFRAAVFAAAFVEMLVATVMGPVGT
jgi:hypothetical protein